MFVQSVLASNTFTLVPSCKLNFDFESIYKSPLEISIPQYSYRLGLYLNKQLTKSIEVNFDHIKYVVTDGQKVRVTGKIGGVQVDGDSILDPQRFLHFEHTDGGNLLHINYVQQKTLALNAAKTRPLINLIWHFLIRNLF